MMFVDGKITQRQTGGLCREVVSLTAVIDIPCQNALDCWERITSQLYRLAGGNKSSVR